MIPAAGSGVRMGTDQAKQFLSLDGRPVVAVTLQAFQLCTAVTAIILVVPPADLEYCQKEIVQKFKLDKVKKVVPGGEKRQESVRLGIEATNGEYGLVVIHDGVRPMITPEFIAGVIEAAQDHRAVITGLRAKETVKEVNSLNEVVDTYDRDSVWFIQTPQAFHYEDISTAHKTALRDGYGEATDDSILIERLGIPVKVVEGSERNIKVTTPNDLELARFLMSQMSIFE